MDCHRVFGVGTVCADRLRVLFIGAPVFLACTVTCSSVHDTLAWHTTVHAAVDAMHASARHCTAKSGGPE